ncbi:MAG: twin-arginine translocation signal domain-containing protein [Burkholderiaceae bacterium]|nr:twin-arginine translocation signal domain-containing protein [Burkholderiaceae bacterium]MCX8005717.1 twin-arginine translocation signal domain-containing protein [Burkholderiaceae bacterium]
MPNTRNRYPARRRFLKQSTALTAVAVALPLPPLAAARQDTAREAPAARPVSRRRKPAP